MSRYATLEDVQGRIPVQQWNSARDAQQPSRALVEGWLDTFSQWVDSTLAWRYAVPITHADDREILRGIVAELVVARVYATLAGHADQPEVAREWRLSAERLLNFDAKSGQARLILPNSTPATSDEADQGISFGTLEIGTRSPYDDYLRGLAETAL